MNSIQVFEAVVYFWLVRQDGGKNWDRRSNNYIGITI